MVVEVGRTLLDGGAVKLAVILLFEFIVTVIDVLVPETSPDQESNR
jgi:hypothetical protein